MLTLYLFENSTIIKFIKLSLKFYYKKIEQKKRCDNNLI